MPLFEYTVLDGKGKKKSGFMEAASPQSARETLKKDGLFIVTLASAAQGNVRSNGDFSFRSNPWVNGDAFASENPDLGTDGDIAGDYIAVSHDQAVGHCGERRGGNQGTEDQYSPVKRKHRYLPVTVSGAKKIQGPNYAKTLGARPEF